MTQHNEDINHLIAQKIGITIEDLKNTWSTIIDLKEAEPDLLEVVKVWKLKQLSPTLFDWWEILVFNPIEDDNGEHYFLYEVFEWGSEHETVDLVEGNERPINSTEGNNCIVELLFENDAHDSWTVEFDETSA
ncbi:MAG: hypothetical protein SWZ49_13135 [Cyanobacteriota bacterium]|nr:hypothetical protein [Cyanobacteriota bacterium]